MTTPRPLWLGRRLVTTTSGDPTPAEVAALVAEARRQLGEPVDEDLIRGAVGDALAGQRPR